MLLPLYAVGRRASGTARLSVVAAFLVWMLLASPITEKHYFTLLLPFFVIGGNALHGTPRARTLARALVVLFGLGAVVASLPKDSVAVLWNDGWLCWSCVLLWAGLLALGLDGRRADIRQAAHEAEAATPDPAPRWRSVSLILPMYNEAANVDETLAAALSCLHHDFVDFEIVAVDDASTDGCADWVAEWAGRKPAIKLVRLAHNRRFGGSLRAGFDAARGDLLVYTDFDLPVPLEHLPQALAALASADELTGHAPGVSKHGSRQAALVSAAYNFLVRTLFGLRLQDINFGFKVMPRSVWRSLSPVSNSPFLDAEMLIQAMRLGYRIKQVEVPFSPRRGGVSRMRRFTVIAATLADMARLWGRLSSGRVETRQVVQL